MKALVVISHDRLRELVKFYLEGQYSIQAHAVGDHNQAIQDLINLEDTDLIVTEYSEVTKKFCVFCSIKKKDIPIFCISAKAVKDPILETRKDWLHWIDPALLIERLQYELESQFKELSDLPYEPKYVKIPLDLLLLASPLPGGVYVQLTDLKHLQLLKVGYELTQNDVDKFSQKGETQLLAIRQRDVNVFALKIQVGIVGLYHRINAAKIEIPASATPKVESPKSTANRALTEKLEKDLSRGFDLAQQISDKIGFTPEVQAITKKNVNEAIKILRSIPSLSQFLTRITKNPDKYIPSHSMLLSYLACALGSQLEWKSDLTYQKLTLAAFLHDTSVKNHTLATIQNLSELSQKEKEFTPQEIKRFKEHPLISAEIARSFTEIPPDVDVIIAQHHERPDGKGFPRGLSASRITPLATVFIVAHDWASYLFQNNAVGDSAKIPDVNSYIKSREELFSIGNFRKVLHAAKSILK
jgi:HD-GYP domain-containing protein (c-di-GMP phosphodiesterase class II)